MLLFQSAQYYLFLALGTHSWRTYGQNQQRPLNAPTLGRNSVLSLHRALVEYESISGNEVKVGKYLHSYLTAHNFTVQRQQVDPLTANAENSRFNLLAYPGGDKHSARVLISSHIDTVPPYWPYENRKSDQIWGRGTVDAKGCVATQIQAVKELLAADKIAGRDVALLFVVGEEIGGDGMRKANDLGLSWETVIFGEPTELKLASGHKGTIGLSIKATGKAGHSGYPWLGENANSMLIPALAALDKVDFPSSKKYGNTTLNIGKMEGGVAGNVIAESAKAQIQIRIAAGSPDKIKAIVIDTINKIDDRLELDFPSKGYGPVKIDTDVEGLNPIHHFPACPIIHLHTYLYFLQGLTRSWSTMERTFPTCTGITRSISTALEIFWLRIQTMSISLRKTYLLPSRATKSSYWPHSHSW